MKPGNAIEAINVKKRFKVYLDKGSSMKEKLLFRSRNRHEDRWVLKGVSFEVKKGEAIGLIGKNGCGKSTTLKMLTRIMYPTSGTIELKGRVSSLIELGAGFHPDMSGKENIFTNASIFGLNHAEIERRLDDIIRFSELEEFIDNPVRTYSSGMYMRLAFAVAINVDADILLIDEILAVGDVSFQAKCFEKLKEIKRKGTTIVIVSHVMGQIEQICDRAIWIEEGLIKMEGKPRDIGQAYLASMEEKRLQKKEEEFAEQRNGEEKVVFSTGEDIRFEIHYKCHIPAPQVDFRVGIARDDGVHCYGISSYSETGKGAPVKEEGYAVLEISQNTLLSGKYLIDVGIKSTDQIAYDVISGIRAVQIKNVNSYESGIVKMKHDWMFGC